MSKEPNMLFELDELKILKNDSIGPKYMIMKRVKSEHSLKFVFPFLIRRVLDCVCGEIDFYKKLASGEILLKTKNIAQAIIIFLNPSIKIEVNEDRSLNSLKGVIYCNSLKELSEEEILTELKQQSVIEVKKIMKKEGEVLKETRVIILTFSIPELPEYILIRYKKIQPEFTYLCP